ncbi:hypothetical protein E4T49_07666 [Aureobasidium sp. EXF-10728]|nr:hypothetical protein E4T49_07666 [Aureobasidium sp. EXF-10728]
MSEFISFLPPPGLALANYDSAALHTTQPQDVPEIFRDAMSVREDVFVKEQNIALENEVDIDDARSFHWVAYASVGTSSSDGNAAMEGVNKDSATSAEKTGRKGSTAMRLPVGTIRLVPPPHPPHPQPGSSHKIDNHEGLPQDMQSGLSKTDMHDGKEAYIKLGRLSVLQPFRGLGLARLLIDAALTWAAENVDKILPPVSPAAAEQRKLELGGGAEVEDVWRGLVLVHAQAYLEKYWASFGFVKDESMAKGGWHPGGGKDNSNSSSSGGGSGWRSKINDKIPSRINDRIPGSTSKSERERIEARENHVSQPLTSLRDPASFAPPPKHIHYHGQAAATASSSALTTTSSYASTPANTAATRGLGAPLPKEMIQQQQYTHQQAQLEEEEASRPPPGPYRIDTTGLSTANLPKPPVRRVDTASPSSVSTQPRPPPRQIAPSPAARAPLPPPRSTPTPPTAPLRQQPALPPRLPPRQNSHPDLNSPSPPPVYQEVQQPAHVPAPDQGAINRLTRAGVSVPGFDIGARNASPASAPPPSSMRPPQPSQMNELQSRFSRMASSDSSQTQPSQSSNGLSSRFGNMVSQQASNPQVQSRLAGLASSPTVRNHAASVASSPAVQKQAVQHAGTFASASGASPQQAHALQSGFSRIAASPTAMNLATQHAGTVASAASSFAPNAAVGKKPPPPPPKKKELQSDAPPVPLSSKPRF